MDRYLKKSDKSYLLYGICITYNTGEKHLYGKYVSKKEASNFMRTLKADYGLTKEKYPVKFEVVEIEGRTYKK